MSLRVESAKLVGLLTDLAATASKAEDALPTSAVLVHSTRGEDPHDVGRVDLLVGTSTNRFNVGHTHIRAEGQLPGPMLWPILEVHNLIDALKRKTRGEKDDSGDKHAVRISKVGPLVEVIEDPAQRKLFGEKLWSTRFPVGDLNDYPRAVWDLLRSANRAVTPVFDDGRQVHPLPRVDLDAAYLAPFLAISKRRGWRIEAYMRHHRLPIHIQIGPEYRGAVVPAHYSDSDRTEGIEPDGEIYDPGLPPRVEPAPRDAPRVDLDSPAGSTADGDD
jgi:S-DNA-T family DNA segregation ATPase FtsK/SpoIIIE